MHIRPYRVEDAVPTREIFERAVHTTGATQYSSEQIGVWAPRDLDPAGIAAWGARRMAVRTLVAIESEQVAGFSDLVDDILLDMLYVDPRFGRRGVGSMLISSIIRIAGAADAPYVETHASLVARPVFERHGFVVIAQQTPVIHGVAFTNFKMRLPLNEYAIGFTSQQESI